jgi:glyoxylase-like metal-dependent hydrolase (beta-lactamase superfamily II)
MRPLGGRLLDGRPGLLRRSELVCHCLLLETDAGLVLVETGMGTPSTDRPDEWLGREFRLLTGPTLGEGETAVAQIERLGFWPSDVRHVVLTHLDLDHAGGLVDFPQATVHVYATELRALRSPANLAERKRYRAAQFAHGPRFRPYEADGDRWFGFDAVRELDGLDPDVLIVPLGGHTRGHAGVAVRADSTPNGGWLLHAGDSYFHRGEIHQGEPGLPPGLRLFETLVQTEKTTRLANQERLRSLVTEHGDEVTVFSAHDAVEYRRLAEPRPGRAPGPGRASERRS